MRIAHITVAALVSAFACSGPFAADPTPAETSVKRDEFQQKRIERGLETGQLNTREAGKLEQEQRVINRMEGSAMKDGKVTPREQRALDRAKDRASQDIRRQKHDAQAGNPQSASSQRLQADVGRNIKQQQRIERGMQSGQMTNREAAVAETGQAHSERKQARAAAGGQVTAAEQARIQSAESRHSKGIYRKKHNERSK